MKKSLSVIHWGSRGLRAGCARAARGLRAGCAWAAWLRRLRARFERDLSKVWARFERDLSKIWARFEQGSAKKCHSLYSLYIGFRIIGIVIGRYEKCHIGILSVSADKKIEFIGLYRYRLIWKKAYRSYPATAAAASSIWWNFSFLLPYPCK